MTKYRPFALCIHGGAGVITPENLSEADKKLIIAMVQNEKHELIKDEYVQTEEEILQQIDSVNTNRDFLYAMLDGIAAL